jgi:hypothetical protein
MMRDEKLVAAAIRCNQPIERVVWIWGAILESAAEVNDGGRFDLDMDEVAHFLRCDVTVCNGVVTALTDKGRVTGDRVANWDKRQWKSDDSTDRVRKHRSNKKRNKIKDGCNIECNDDETLRNGPETETETETEKKESSRAPRVETRKFEEFWKEYPKRKGDNPKSPARKAFEAAVRQGADPDAIISGVRRAKARNTDKIGTEFIPQAIKWLRDRRWEDYQDDHDPPNGPLIPDDAAFEFFKKFKRWHRDYGPEPGKPGCRASPEVLAKYGYEPKAA